MPEAENHFLPGATNDSWRTWLMTGVRRTAPDRRRMRGEHEGLKRMLLEGMGDDRDQPHAWRDFSGAMIRHAVDDAMRSLPREDTQVVKLAYFGGFSNREIAAQVGVTEASVQRRLRRALSVISERIHHGRAIGRRMAFAVMFGLGGRWLHDSVHPLGYAVAAAGAAVIIVAQPAAQGPPVTAPHAQPVQSGAGAATTQVVPSIPSPTAANAEKPPAANLPISLPVSPPPLPPLPPLPSPPVKLPTL